MKVVLLIGREEGKNEVYQKAYIYNVARVNCEWVIPIECNSGGCLNAWGYQHDCDEYIPNILDSIIWVD